MTRITKHNIEKIKIEKAEKIGSNTYTRDILITDTSGEVLVFQLFANNKQKLKTHMEEYENDK